jgi:uncharacterized protein (DUF2141 family)
MKRIVFLFFFCGCVTHLWCQNESLTVIVKNIKGEKGTVGAALYQAEKQFMKTIWQSRSGPSRPGEMTFVFESIPPGEYAISVLHDLNNNGKMDSNFFGVPREGFGFSNDAIGAFGPPDFQKAKFLFPERREVIITMKYF